MPDAVPWNGDAGNGDDKSKEGYMPIKEDDEDKFWKRPGWGRYQNPWEYDSRSYRNNGNRWARPGPPNGYTEDQGKKAVEEDAKTDDSEKEQSAVETGSSSKKEPEAKPAETKPAVKAAPDAPSEEKPGSDLPPELQAAQ